MKYYEGKLYLGGPDIRSTKIWYYDLETKKAVLQKDFIDTELDVDIFQLAMVKNNDIYYIGNTRNLEGSLIHYNGERYKGIIGGFHRSSSYGGAHTDGNICASVGFYNNKAFVTIIRRN
jgi:hypothetical protein